MSSGVFLDSEGRYDGRSRHDILTDFKLHEWVKDEVGGGFSSKAELEEGLSDDIIYLVEKDYYHTWSNVDREKAHKVEAGPEGLGKAGDMDVGKIDIPSGKITKVELKSPGHLPEKDNRSAGPETYEAVREGLEQNEYLKELIDDLSVNEGVEIPYTSRVRVWNDVVDDQIRNLNEIPKYSDAGNFLCTTEARKRAEESEKLKTIDRGLFRNWLFGGGEDILEGIDEVLEK